MDLSMVHLFISSLLRGIYQFSRYSSIQHPSIKFFFSLHPAETPKGAPSQMAYRHHFGLTGGGSALGLPPQRVAASESREGREGREGLHFEAAVLGQLHSSKRMEAWEKRTKTGEMRDMAKPQGVDLFSML